MTEDARYDTFLREAARELAGLPDTVASLLSGRAMLRLGPEFHDRVLRGHRDFGRPRDQVRRDLEAAVRARRLSPGLALHAATVRLARTLLVAARVIGAALFSIPVAVRRLRRRRDRLAADGHRAAAHVVDASRAPRVSIVVLSFNRLGYLRETLEHLRRTRDVERCELIVVDHGSRDGSAEYLRREHERGRIGKLALRRDNHGISAGYNYGFALADPRSPYLMKLDDDICILTPDWLERSTAFLEAHPSSGFVALNQLNHPVLRVVPRERIDGTLVMWLRDWPCGSVLILSRAVREQLGHFVEHETLTYVPDDVDYLARAMRAGFRPAVLADVTVLHQMHAREYRGMHSFRQRLEAGRLALRLARDYDRGARPIAFFYDRYARIDLPENGRIDEGLATRPDVVDPRPGAALSAADRLRAPGQPPGPGLSR